MPDETRNDGASAPDPDWGLGATADPVAFGEAMAVLGKRLAGDPATLAGATMRFATGLAQIGTAVAARAVGAPTGSTFPIGVTVVSCTATDATGNQATASFKIDVEGAAEQLVDLHNAVRGIGPGTSLPDKLKAAQAAYAAGDEALTCEILNAFIRQVNAGSGKSIATGTATMLIADAQRIRVVLGCSP